MSDFRRFSDPIPLSAYLLAAAALAVIAAGLVAR